LSQFPHLFPFAFQYLIKNKLYVHGNWELNIDVELTNTNCAIGNSNNLDEFGVNNIKIDYSIPEETYNLIEHVKSVLKNIMAKEQMDIEELNIGTTSLKLEDTYHPFRLYQPNTPFLDRFNPLSNLYVCHTGLLNRAGGLNPTAVLFCLIEELVENKLNIRSLD
jgi:hypothetical protein